jgi:hypothetical protein
MSRPHRFTVGAVCAVIATVALFGAGAQAAGPAKGATYRGATGKPGNNPISFKVARDGRHVTGLSTHLGYDGKCGQGGGPNFEVRASSITLKGNGRFSRVVTATLGPFKVKIQIAGRIKGRKATGTIEEVPANTCKGPPNDGANAYFETFSATAK